MTIIQHDTTAVEAPRLIGPPITRMPYLVATPTQRAELDDDTPTHAEDITAVLEAAARMHLDEVELTGYQQLNMTRLFPRTDDVNAAWWRLRIENHLAAVADALRLWWMHDLGIEVDQVPVPQWQADASRRQAEQLADHLITRSAA